MDNAQVQPLAVRRAAVADAAALTRLREARSSNGTVETVRKPAPCKAAQG